MLAVGPIQHGRLYGVQVLIIFYSYCLTLYIQQDLFNFCNAIKLPLLVVLSPNLAQLDLLNLVVLYFYCDMNKAQIILHIGIFILQ